MTDAELELAAADVAAQLALWGWAVSGAPDFAAAHAEQREGDGPMLCQERGVGWDGDAAWLERTTVVEYGQDPRPFRAWAALPWLVEWYARRPLEGWPGL